MTASNDPRALVSVVAPVYNEVAVLAELVRRMSTAVAPLGGRYRFEFILVNDGSRDDSLLAAGRLVETEPRLRVIDLRRNYGQTAALQAGVDAAKGDFIITMDADLQHFPEEIPKFLAKIEEGYDVICGWRHERKEGVVRRWPSRAANALIRVVSGLRIHDIGTTFRAYRREIIEDITLLGENHRYIPALAHRVGARIAEIPIENVPRPVGRSNYSIGRMPRVLLDVFLIYFLMHYLDRPLRVFGAVFLILELIAALIVGTLLVMSTITGQPTVREHSGWFILALVMALAGLQSLLTGLLSEMVALNHFSSPQRRRYSVRREISAEGNRQIDP